ncbi:hypothetical protein D3C71_1351400 [compost metagenome]
MGSSAIGAAVIELPGVGLRVADQAFDISERKLRVHHKQIPLLGDLPHIRKVLHCVIGQRLVQGNAPRLR